MADVSAAIVAAANVAWPPRTIGLRISTAEVARSLGVRRLIAERAMDSACFLPKRAHTEARRFGGCEGYCNGRKRNRQERELSIGERSIN